jgi:hypothetical protein
VRQQEQPSSRLPEAVPRAQRQQQHQHHHPHCHHRLEDEEEDEEQEAEAEADGGRGGRGRGRGSTSRGRGNHAPTRSTGPAFKGNTDGMKGNIFTCHRERSPDEQQHLKTVGVLEEHINKTFSCPRDVASVCKSFEIAQLVQPANLTKEEHDTDMGKKMIWETPMKNYMKCKDLMESNTIAICAVAWGQCSPMMQSKLESLDNFDTKNKTCDCVWLLKEIQGVTHRFEGTRNVFISLNAPGLTSVLSSKVNTSSSTTTSRIFRP